MKQTTVFEHRASRVIKMLAYGSKLIASSLTRCVRASHTGTSLTFDYSRRFGQNESKIERVTLVPEAKYLSIKWKSHGAAAFSFDRSLADFASKFSYYWLRDNSPDAKTVKVTDALTIRAMHLRTMPVDLSITSMESDHDKLRVRWSDEHESVFDANWLRFRDISDDRVRAARRKVTVSDRFPLFCRKTTSKHTAIGTRRSSTLKSSAVATLNYSLTPHPCTTSSTRR